jgi:replication-associated recombination protein RarA
MSEVLLNTVTKKVINGFLKKPSHAVVLVGPRGAGKGQVAKYLASRLLQVEQNRVASHPFFVVVEPQNNTIAIDTIRETQKVLGLKVPGQQPVRRVVVIENAQTMTLEAQNALLKSLEEPPIDTVIILTTTGSKLLLPTIESRAQTINLLPVSKEQISTLSVDDKLIALADGRPGLMNALVNDPEHELVKQIVVAKDFLTKSPYERLLMAQNMKEKETISIFLQALLIVTNAALHTSTTKAWQARTKRIYEAQRQFQQNASTKLLLTDLALSL